MEYTILLVEDEEAFHTLKMKEEYKDKTKEQLINALVGLRQRITELEASENEKRSILDAMSDILLFQDTNLSIRWGNEAAGRSVGTTRRELTGRYCYKLWHGRSEPCEECPVLKALKTGSHANGIRKTPDGGWWEVVGEPVWDGGGNIVGEGGR